MFITKVEKVIAGIILALLLLSTIGSYYIVSEINEHGLKVILEEIWEGPEE